MKRIWLLKMQAIKMNGAPSRIVFVETDEMTDGVLPVGDYTVEGDTLKISVILMKNNVKVGKEIVVTGKVGEAEKVIKEFVGILIKSI